MEARRRNAILTGLERELQRNWTATKRTLDTGNGNCRIGSLATVAFERHGSELATVTADSVEVVFEHYATVGAAREGLRSFAARPDGEA